MIACSLLSIGWQGTPKNEKKEGAVVVIISIYLKVLLQNTGYKKTKSGVFTVFSVSSTVTLGHCDRLSESVRESLQISPICVGLIVF